jgi:FKBP-type peptidyl-prolyl cis-trans isomerase
MNEEKKPLPFESKEEYKETMIHSHKAYLNRERNAIYNYMKASPFRFDSTGTGLKYAVYEGGGTDSLKVGDVAVIHYTLRNLEGDTLYQSLSAQPQEFMVEYDNVEKGLHEGIQRIAIGDRAIFILPAHLAHGITGDQAAISHQQTLVYDLHLLGRR